MLGIPRCLSFSEVCCPLDLIHVFTVVDGGDDFLFFFFFFGLFFQKLEIISLWILSSFILALNTK